MLKIGEVSKRSGVGIEALRFYENAGLLNKAARTPAGYRLYDEEVIERLAFVKRAQSLGLSLEEIKRVIERAASGIDPCDEVRELVRRRLRELDLRLREMRRYRRELKSTLDGWNKLGQVEGKVCGLIEASQMENSARRRTEGLKHK
ncbi:MAG TPA: MerR family transcriptional regulator [Pyrinomonadaceae bacterium]